MKSGITTAEFREVKRLRLQGFLLKVIARRLGLSLAQVSRAVRKMGLATKPRRLWTEEEIRRLIRMREENVRLFKMAEQLGRRDGTVYRKLSELNIPLPRRTKA